MIRVNNLTKKYGKFEAVKEVAFSVDSGCIYGFVGKNGAGKSTLIRCMMNLLQPSSGDIMIDGLDSKKDNKKIKSFVSYMPSEITYYDNLTVRKFMKFNLRFSKLHMEDVERWATYFELDLDKKLGELSLGNKKKVSIIIMLLKDAHVLVMDEPTSGLDPLIQKKFFDVMIEEKKKGKTIFLSSHNLTEIERYCAQVAIIRDGEIVDIVDLDEVTIQHTYIVFYRTKDNQEVTKEFNGDMNELVAELSQLDLTELEIKPKGIEDEFIQYYQEEVAK